MSRALSRRNVLKGAGGLVLGLPLLSSLRAHAEGLAPRRFLVFFHPNGVLPEKWFPTPGATEHDFTFSPSLAPLAPFRKDVLITRGIDLQCVALGPGEPHQKGMGALLTGWHLNPGTMVGGDGSLAGWAMGQSIDQRIAQVIGTTTKVGSLLLGTRSKGGDVRHHLSYAGSDQPLPVIGDPTAAWNALFSELGEPSPEQERIRHRRASVLDAVRGQLRTLSNTLPPSERVQLDRHLTQVRDLEQRLAATINGEACAPVQPPALAPDSETTMPDVAKWQIDLMVMALACDLTRVGTLQFSQAQNYISFPWIDSSHDGHALSHLGSSDPSREQIAWRDAWYAERFAYLLQQLSAIPEGEGSLLDHTLIWWVNELGLGNTHSQKDMPFILAGNAAGFRMGRYVQYAGASHSNLLLSILHGMGVDDGSFGNPDFQTGELSGLR